MSSIVDFTFTKNETTFIHHSRKDCNKVIKLTLDTVEKIFSTDTTIKTIITVGVFYNHLKNFISKYQNINPNIEHIHYKNITVGTNRSIQSNHSKYPSNSTIYILSLNRVHSYRNPLNYLYEKSTVILLGNWSHASGATYINTLKVLYHKLYIYSMENNPSQLFLTYKALTPSQKLLIEKNFFDKQNNSTYVVKKSVDYFMFFDRLTKKLHYANVIEKSNVNEDVTNNDDINDESDTRNTDAEDNIDIIDMYIADSVVFVKSKIDTKKSNIETHLSINI